MDIKSKNKILCFIFFIAASVFLAGTLISAVDIMKNHNYFRRDYYFNSMQFKSEAAEYMRNAVRLNTEIRSSDTEYGVIKKYLESKPALRYYIIFNSGRAVYTNIKGNTDINRYINESGLYSLKLPAYIIGDTIYPEINLWFKNTNSEGWIVIDKNTQGYNEIIEGYKYYLSIRQRVIKESWICFVAAVMFLLAAVLPAKRGIRCCSLGEAYKKKASFDLRVVLFLLYTAAMVVYIFNMSFFYMPMGLDQLLKLVITSFYGAFAITSFATFPKSKLSLQEEWEKAFTSRFIKKAADDFDKKSIGSKTAYVIFLTVIFGTCISGFVLSIENNMRYFPLALTAYILLYILFMPRYIIGKIRYLNKIIQGTEAITAGDLNYSIDEKGRGNLNKLAVNVNNMRKSFKNSLESEMKSERLKSELITNVSHDLKTPLTSIINYIDLLKKEDISRVEMGEYISILDRKSQRLKVIIEDLFEASKIASGSVELNIETLDVISLLNQALAEFDEKIKEASLEFKANYPNHKVYIDLDGKKTWRVFENLIGNILKYSQKNTRVYIDVIEKESSVYIVMKNISAFELNFDVDEIFERFKRGDQSRSTEGSGLGLAIAKSIVEMQGGRLTIQIDGDLFKSIIEFNK